MIFGDKYTNVPIFHERERHPLRIVGDAAIASSYVGEGRLIPLVILDTTDRPDLAEHIRVHEFIGPGDVKFRWGRLDGKKDKVMLSLTFLRPAELVAIIEFDILRHGILVEQILSSNGLYIQAGKEGDRLKHDINVPKIIAEISETGFRPIWDKLFQRHVVSYMREKGLGRQQAKQAAKAAISDLKRMGKMRMPS